MFGDWSRCLNLITTFYSVPTELSYQKFYYYGKSSRYVLIKIFVYPLNLFNWIKILENLLKSFISVFV